MDLTIVEMGVEDKMTPEDQHGGYSHPTTHCTSSDPIRPSVTSLTDSVYAILAFFTPIRRMLRLDGRDGPREDHPRGHEGAYGRQTVALATTVTAAT